MNKLDNFSFMLFLTQIIEILIFIFIIIFLVKLYKKINKYLDKKK